MLKRIFRIYVLVFVMQTVKCDLYTSVDSMQDLLKTEQELIKYLEKYLEVEEETTIYIRNYVTRLKQMHEYAQEDTENYLSHPLNLFALMKRLVKDWSYLEEKIAYNSQDFKNKIENRKQYFKFPIKEDLNGAINALLRLQQTYNFTTQQIIKGQFEDGTDQISSSLNSDDCLDIAIAINITKSKIHWLHECVNLYDGSLSTRPTQISIVQHLVYEYFLKDSFDTASTYINYGLTLSPTDELFLEYKKAIEKRLYDSHLNKIVEPAPTETKLLINPYLMTEKEMNRYRKTCSGSITLPLKEQSKLKCYYIFGKITKIRPFKVEDVKLKPHIIQFHDVIYDTEIEELKKLARPALKRSQVAIETSFNDGRDDDSRISKNMWLRNEDHKFLEIIDNRIEDMTGLCIKSAEDIQIANYGLAGQYEPHLDFRSKFDGHMKLDQIEGNRIATLMFYLTDVPAGGKTAFTLLKIALKPIKGSAVLWYNLYHDGEGDYSTYHAACPVIVGNKWVANKWIRERGQIFRRQCKLQPDSVPDSEWIKLID